MNSFTLTAVGNLARNPELVARGDMAYTRFCLVGNDYAGRDEEGAAREVVTTLWFVAFGAFGEAIARNSRKGDQLFVEARVRSSNWIDKQGEKQYDHDFVVQGFRWGAPGRVKREEREARQHEGTLRVEDRGNGRDRAANAGESPNTSASASSSVGEGPLVSTEGNTSAESDASPAAEGTGDEVKAGSDVSANESAAANSERSTGRSAREKSNGQRSGRRAAASVG